MKLGLETSVPTSFSFCLESWNKLFIETILLLNSVEF